MPDAKISVGAFILQLLRYIRNTAPNFDKEFKFQFGILAVEIYF
jgi:hypothetical protein